MQFFFTKSKVPASRQFSSVVLQHASHLSTVPNLFWKIREFDVHVTVHRDKFPYNKNQLDVLISQIYFGMKLYMFWTVPLSIIRSYSLHTLQWCMLYRFADSLLAGSGWNCTSILILLALLSTNQYDIHHCCVCSE